MSTIQNLKNFIRHGKQARGSNPPHADPTTNVSPVHAQQQRYQGHYAGAQGGHGAISDPNVLAHRSLRGGPITGDYSVANLDNRNVAAQAGGAAARAAGENQKAGHDKRARDAEIEQLVAEERQTRNKLPKYPGLERWILVEKMGDGAFSNVYRAKDSTGQMGEVAIKVVRKFELNQNQVRRDHGKGFLLRSLPSFLLLSTPLDLQAASFEATHLPTMVQCRATLTFIRISRNNQR